MNQLNNDRTLQWRGLHELEGCHLVLPAGFQPRLDSSKLLAPPEAEEDAFVLRTDQKDRAVREVHQVAPFDGLAKSRGSEKGGS